MFHLLWTSLSFKIRKRKEKIIKTNIFGLYFSCIFFSGRHCFFLFFSFSLSFFFLPGKKHQHVHSMEQYRKEAQASRLVGRTVRMLPYSNHCFIESFLDCLWSVRRYFFNLDPKTEDEILKRIFERDKESFSHVLWKLVEDKNKADPNDLAKIWPHHLEVVRGKDKTGKNFIMGLCEHLLSSNIKNGVHFRQADPAELCAVLLDALFPADEGHRGGVFGHPNDDVVQYTMDRSDKWFGERTEIISYSVYTCKCNGFNKYCKMEPVKRSRNISVINFEAVDAESPKIFKCNLCKSQTRCIDFAISLPPVLFYHTDYLRHHDPISKMIQPETGILSLTHPMLMNEPERGRLFDQMPLGYLNYKVMGMAVGDVGHWQSIVADPTKKSHAYISVDGSKFKGRINNWKEAGLSVNYNIRFKLYVLGAVLSENDESQIYQGDHMRCISQCHHINIMNRINKNNKENGRTLTEIKRTE